MRLPFFYGWLVVAVAFVTMAIGVNARTAFSLLFPPILLRLRRRRGQGPDFDYTARMISCIRIVPPALRFAFAPPTATTG